MKYIDEIVYGDNLDKAKKVLKEVVGPESAEEPYLTNILARLIWLHKEQPRQRDEKGRYAK